MANLTNSSKLITKIEAIDSSISSIEDKIGSVPAGTDIMAEIGALDDKSVHFLLVKQLLRLSLMSTVKLMV